MNADEHRFESVFIRVRLCPEWFLLGSKMLGAGPHHSEPAPAPADGSAAHVVWQRAQVAQVGNLRYRADGSAAHSAWPALSSR